MDPLQLYKTLADETRLSVVMLLIKHGPMCVCDLTDVLGESQPKVSRHLAVLKASGLLSDTKKAQWVYYQINSALKPWVLKSVQLCYEAVNQDKLSSFAQLLAASKSTEC